MRQRFSLSATVKTWGTYVLLLSSLSGCFSKTDFVLNEAPGLLVSPIASWLDRDLVSVPADGNTQATVKVNVRSKTAAAKAGQTVVLVSSRGSSDTITAVSAVTDSTGVATFRVKSTVPGTPTFIATVGSVVISRTTSVTFMPAIPVKLVYSVQPSATLVAGGTLSTQPSVNLLDAYNNLVATSTLPVTLNAYSDASCSTPVATTPDGTASLAGTTTQAASGGVATFSGVQMNRSGTLYLQASSSGLTSACSAAITVSPGAFSLADSDLAASASTVTSGSSITLTLTAKDQFGNPAPTGVTTVVISKASGAGNGTYGAVSDAGGGIYTVSFTGSTAGVVTSQATINGSAVTDTENVTVNPGPKTKLAFSTQPSSTNVAGASLAAQPVVAILDAANNVVPSATDTISLSAYSDSACSTTPIATTPDGSATLGGTISLAATAGVSTFSGVSANRAGAVYVQATASGLSSACSQLITVSPGAFSLADSTVTSSAATVNSGSSVTLTMTGKDAYGNASPTGITAVVFSRASGAGNGTYGSVTNAGSGVYTVSFTGTTVGVVTNQATINGSAVTDTENVTVNPGTPSKLFFSVEPASTNVAGSNLGTQPVVQIQDASSNVVTSATDTVVLAAYSDASCSTAIATTPDGSNTLSGTLSVAAVSGVSSFSGIGAHRAGSVYLRASSGALTTDCSNAIAVTPGAFSLADSTVSSSAATVASGSSITITMTGKDAYGNAAPTGITTVAFSSTTVGGTGTFGSVTNAGSGVYTSAFTGQVAGLVTISSTINGSGVTDTENVTVTNGTATKLTFTTEPAATNVAGSNLSTQPVVAVQDAVGNTVVSATDTIVLAAYSDAACSTAIATTPDGSNTLSGTLSKAAVSGVASYTGLGAHRAGNVYLQATSGSLTSDCSNAIAVSPGAFSLADSTVTSSAATVNAGASVTLTMTGKDAYGNAAPTGITAVVFSKASGAGDGTYGSVTAAGSGVYTVSFTGTTAGVVTNQATINGSTVVDTENVTVNPGAATQLVFSTEPSSTATAGANLGTQPVVQIRDASNNVVTGATDTVVLAAYSDASCSTAIATTPNGSNTLSGTLSLAATAGVATYSGIKANRAGSVYLLATSGSLTTDCSQLITVGPGAFSLADSTVTSSAATVNSGSSVTVTMTGKDAYGNAAPTGITAVVFSKASGAGNGTFGSVTNAGSGVYTNSFTGTTSGLLAIQATINASAVTDTENVTVNPGTATKLVFSTEPASTNVAGSNLGTQPVVQIQDASSNVVTGATDTVVLAAYSDASCSTAIATTPDGSNTLSGTLSVAAVSGVSTFSGIGAHRAGSVYLRASSGALTTDCSNAIAVTPGAFSLADSTVTSSAATVASGSSITITMTGKDTYGNAAPTGITTVAFSSTTVGGTGTFGSVTNAGSGVYTSAFTGQVAGLVTISSTINSSSVVDTENVTVTNGTATKLVFSTQPASTNVAGSVLSTQPVVQIQDASSNVVTTATDTISVAAYSNATCTTSAFVTPDGSGTLSGTLSATASAGVATFSGIGAHRAGNLYLRASGGGLTTSCSAAIAVSPGAFSLADSAVTSSSATVASGSSVTITLTGKDNYGNLSPTGMTTIVFSKASGAGDGTFGSVTNAGSGVYTSSFTGTTGGLLTIQSTINGSTVTDTENVTVGAGAATQLVFSTEPASTNVAGSILGTQPVVQIRDASNNVVTTATDTVVLTAYSDAACSTTAIPTTANGYNTLGGTTSLAATSGVATFSGIRANRAGPVYIKASSGSLTTDCSQLITVSPGGYSLSYAEVTSSAATVASGSSVTITLTGKDAFGNTNPTGMTTIAFSKASGAGNGTFGSVTNAGSGVYTTTFTGTTGGLVTIQATINTQAVTDTENVTVNPGAATQLVFSTEPSTTNTAGSNLSTQPVVQIRDASNNVVTSATDTVVLSSFSDATCATSLGWTPNGLTTLSGTLSVAAASGVATFSGIGVHHAGTVYIKASSGSLTSDCSNAIAVSPGAFSLAYSTVTSSAASVNSGSSVTLTLTGKDAFGNTNPSGMTTIVFSKASGAGTGTFGGSVTNAGSGVYTNTFTGGAAGLVTIQATINGSTVTDTEDVTVVGGTATKLVFSTQPSSTNVAGAVLATQPVVQIQDVSSNVVTSATDTVTLSAFSNAACTTAIATTASGASTIEGTAAVAAVSGVVTYSGIKANRAGSVYLKATSGSLTAACSQLITVSPGVFTLANSTTGANSASVLAGSSTIVRMRANDAYGNAAATGVTSVVFSRQSGSGNGTFGAATEVSAGVWEATFTATTVGSLNVQSVPNGGSAVADAKTITVTSAGASKLAFTTQPATTGAAGALLTTQPVIAVQDAGNNTVTTATDTVTLSLYGDSGCSTTPITTTFNSSAAINGNLNKAAASGVVTHSDIVVYQSGTVYVKASATGLTAACSNAVTVSAGSYVLAQSTVEASASTVAAGSSINVKVIARDAYGNPTDSGGFSSPGFSQTGTGSCTISAASPVDVGTYQSTCTGQAAGTLTLKGVLSGSATTSSVNITVTAGTASQLVFTTQPGDGPIGSALTTQPVVKIADAGGNVVSSTANVTLSLASGTGTLGGTVTVAAVAGVATFSGISVSLEGAKTLGASATVGSAISGTSSSFRVVKVAHTSPAAAFLVDNSNIASINIAGTCSEEGRAVSLSYKDPWGNAGWNGTNSATCTGGVFSIAMGNMGGLENGTITATVSQTSAGGATHSYTTTLNKQEVRVHILVPKTGALITAENEAAFNVKGYCSHNGQAVTVTLGGLTSTPTCTNNGFSVNFNASGLSTGSKSITADHSYGAINAGQATATVTKKACSWNSGTEYATVPVNSSCHVTPGSSRPHSVWVQKNALGSIAANTWFQGSPNGLSISTDGGTTWTTKTTAQGLPHNNINSINVTSTGTILLATNAGLAISTDGGSTWTKKTTTNGLPSNYLLEVVSYGTTYYVGSDQGVSISTDSGSTWTNKFVGGDVSGILVHSGVIWAVSGWGLFKSTDGGANYTNPNGYPPLFSVATDGTRLYLGGNAGVIVTTDMTATGYNTYDWDDNVPAGEVWRIRLNSSGHIFVAGADGLAKSTNGGASWTTLLGSNQTMDVFVDSSDNVYMASRKGFSVSTNGGTSFTHYSSASPRNNYARSFYGDDWSRGLAADANHLYSITGSMNQVRKTAGWGSSSPQDEFVSVTSDYGASFQKLDVTWICQTYTSVATDNIGRLYVGCHEGLFVRPYGDYNFTRGPLTTAHGLGTTRVNGVAIGSDGKIYVATNGGLSISSNEGVSFVNKTTADGLGSNTVRNVVVDSNGYIYAATANGLSISTNGGTSFVNRTTAIALGSNNVYDVAVDANRIYVATDAGVSISGDLTGATWSNRSLAEGLGTSTVTGIAVYGSSIYAATSGGLSVSTTLSGTTFVNKTVSDGLGANAVSNVAIANGKVFTTSTLWGGLQRQISTLAPATGLGWTASSPAYQGGLAVTWTQSTSSYTSQNLQFFSDSTCTTTLTGQLNVGTANYWALSVSNPGSYTYKITTINGSESRESACSSVMVVKQAFQFGVNFGGDSTVRVINGNTWLTLAQAMGNGLSFTTAYTQHDSNSATLNGGGAISTNPAATGDLQQMLYHTTWANGTDLGFTLPVANATYRIYFYVHENYETNHRSSNVILEGTTYESSAMKMSANEWMRLGPYDVTVTDSSLSVLFQRLTGNPHLSGMEIHKIDPAGTVVDSDNFNNASINSSRWKQWDNARPATSNGSQAVCAPLANTTTDYPGIESQVSFDFTNKGVVFEMIQPISNTSGDEDFIYIAFGTGNSFTWYPKASSIRTYQEVGGTTTWQPTTTYNSTNHRWFRIRHDSMGNWVIYEVSPDAVTWTQYYKHHPAIGITTGYAGVGCGVWQSTPSPGTALFDNYYLIQY